jgi:hypothetical protein
MTEKLLYEARDRSSSSPSSEISTGNILFVYGEKCALLRGRDISRVGRFRIFNNPPIARWPYTLIMEIYGLKPYIYGIGQP